MPARFAFLRTTFLSLMLTVACVPAFAQQAPDKTASKTTNQTASQTPASTTSKAQGSSKSSKETTCDGALEIVPRKQVSFVRKRRPADKPSAPTTPADAKPAKKSSDETLKTSSIK